jgi:hypothetical protein
MVMLGEGDATMLDKKRELRRDGGWHTERRARNGEARPRFQGENN